MTKNRGGFRENFVISRNIKKTQEKMDNIMYYIFRKILCEEYIFITGTDEIIEDIISNEGMKIGVVEVEGEDLDIISNNISKNEKLFMAKKDENLVKFMDGRNIEKLIGLMIKKGENSEEIFVAQLDNDEKFNIENVGNLLFKIFPRQTIKRNLQKLQRDLLNAMMIDGLMELHKNNIKK